METLKVSTRSHPNSVAGAIAGLLRREGVAVLTVVGAGALNQAIKALAITRDQVVGEGMDPVCIPSFTEVDIEGVSRTAILLRVEDRGRGAIAASRPEVIDLREHLTEFVDDPSADYDDAGAPPPPPPHGAVAAG
jgi:stage V sporulation protein S